MKYMGSKRAMLQTGLGLLLNQQAKRAKRFFDLFCGSGAVAIHVAEHTEVTVIANDLQKFSAVLADAIISRDSRLDLALESDRWLRRARRAVEAVRCPNYERLSPRRVLELRRWSERQTKLPLTRAYGGYYFAPLQAVWLDTLRSTMPDARPIDTVALAALIWAASRCAASPGHTAQPFAPTRTALPFIEQSWAHSAPGLVASAFVRSGHLCARRKGWSVVGDANQLAGLLEPGDLAFVDPPYSAVHYSRFYHVLESLATGYRGPVSGAGRYPPSDLRPKSRYSYITQSEDALDDLLATLAGRGARVIVTFPDEDCSNGLTGDVVREVAAEHFRVSSNTLVSRFSTLGGNGKHRSARNHSSELVLVLDPR